MNREIKFRAWNTENEEMVYLENSGLQYYDFEGSYSLGFTVDGYTDFWAHEQYEELSKKSNTFPIMQYTGIKDKNGKEIYEGDILQIPALHSDQPESNPYDIVQIIIRNGCTMWKDISTGKEELIYLWLGDSDTDEDSTIIGNIYENPELINSK